MIIFLITANIILIVSLIYIVFFRKSGQSGVFSDLEGIELIEFQQNLRELIERLHKVSEGEIREMEEKKKQIEEAVAAADTKIRELRYLIERNQLARKAEYKTAISIPPVQEELIPGIIKKTGQADAPAKQISTGKFSIIDSQQLKHHDSAETENSEKANMTPKNRFDHIKMLVKNGMAIEDIAKVTGLSRGEIELIRNLKK